MNDFDVIRKEKSKMFLDLQNLSRWTNEKLLTTTTILKTDDEDIIRLLIFCVEITYQMFSGGTRATITAKGFRERRRTFETILVDQFVGKLGEVMLKKFIEKIFPHTVVTLDWEISREIENHRTDIINAKKKISVRTSPSLTGIWAEADLGYDYGIMVKCSVPQQPILQFFIEVCGFTKLLNYAEIKIPTTDDLFVHYLQNLRNRVERFKCGELNTQLKGVICGFFKTSEYSPVEKGEELPFLGIVREKRYLIPINKLKWTKEDWRNFIEDVGLHA